MDFVSKVEKVQSSFAKASSKGTLSKGTLDSKSPTFQCDKVEVMNS